MQISLYVQVCVQIRTCMFSDMPAGEGMYAGADISDSA